MDLHGCGHGIAGIQSCVNASSKLEEKWGSTQLKRYLIRDEHKIIRYPTEQGTALSLAPSYRRRLGVLTVDDSHHRQS